MNTLMIYASKSGTVEQCARRMAQQMCGEVTLVDARKKSTLPEDIGAYDCVIVGTYIRMGRGDASLTAYLQRMQDALLTKPLGLFYCCGFTEQAQMQEQKLFSEALRAHALALVHCGGRLQPKTAGEKLAIGMVRKEMEKNNVPMPEIDEAAMNRLVQKMSEAVCAQPMP